MSKIIYKIIFFVIVLAIIFFLGQNLVINWQQVKEYNFSFNYNYLILSFVLLIFSLSSHSVVWNKILRAIEPEKKISFFKAWRIYIYSDFGRYIPGKIWAILGRVYLGNKEGIAKKKVLIASLFDGVLDLIATLTIGILFLSVYLGNISSYYYLFSLLVILSGFIIVHPKVFYQLFNIFLRIIKKKEILLEDFLSYNTIIKIWSNYIIISLIYTSSFFLFVKAITNVNFNDFFGISGAYALASGIGVIALFAPSGLGVREGVMVVILQLFFPVIIATFISIVARIWFTIGQMALFIVVFLINKLTPSDTS